jgi:hypothetical protein
MDAKQILDWCKVPAALLAMLAAVAFAIDARAQEAAKTEAKATVEQRMVPIEEQLETLVKQGEEQRNAERRREDREELAWCLDREYQDLDKEERQRICDEESEQRWATWAKQDANGGG